MIGALSSVEEQAVREFREVLDRQFGLQIQKVILFGSKARGGYHTDSDIDIFVLMGEGDFRMRHAIADIGFDLLLKYETLISPLVLSLEEYQQQSRWETAFIRNLRRDGISLE